MTRMARVTLTKVSTAFLPCTWFSRSRLQKMKTTPISPLQPKHITWVNNSECHPKKIGKVAFSAYDPFPPTSNGCRTQARLRLPPQQLRATSAAYPLLPGVQRPCVCPFPDSKVRCYGHLKPSPSPAHSYVEGCRSPPLPVPGSLDQSNKSSHKRLRPAPNHMQYTMATKSEP